MQTEQGIKVDIREYWQIFRRRKHLFLLPLVTILLTVFLGSYRISPVYESSTTIMVGGTNFLSSSVQRVVPGSRQSERPGSREYQWWINGLSKKVTSRDYMEKLIDRLGLMDNRLLRERALRAKPKYGDLTVDQIMENWLINSLRRGVNVQSDQAGILKISVRGSTPEGAYLEAKTLSDIFIQETLKGELGGVREALNFSKEQLGVYQAKLKASEEKLRRFKEKMLKSQIQDYSITSANLTQINSMISSTEMELKEAENHLNSLKAKLTREELSSLDRYSSPQLRNLRRELRGTIDQLPALLGRYSWMDAKVVRLNQLIGEIRGKIKQEIKKGGASPELAEAEITKEEIEFLKRKRRNLLDFVGEYTRSLTKGPAQELALSKLQDEVEANRRLYNMFLEQSQGSQIEESLKRAEAEYRFKILEPATKPLRPVKPNRQKLLLLGFILGSMAGFGLVFLSEYMDHSFKRVEEVESYLGVSVLGTIPWMDMPQRLSRRERFLGLKVLLLSVLLFLFLYLTFLKGRG